MGEKVTTNIRETCDYMRKNQIEVFIHDSLPNDIADDVGRDQFSEFFDAMIEKDM